MIEPQGSKVLSSIYKPGFFSRRHKFNWRAPIVVSALREVFQLPQKSKVIDLGCATGDLVAEWRKQKFKAYGIEGSRSAEPYLESRFVYFFDLTSNIRDDIEKYSAGDHMLNSFSLVTCFEVFEHIPPKHADQLVDNVCWFSDLAVVSAAGPGQGGHHHVNCRPKEYWIEKFFKRGYCYDYTRECQLRFLLSQWRRKAGIQAYYHNMMVFYKDR